MGGEGARIESAKLEGWLAFSGSDMCGPQCAEPGE